MGKKTHGPRLLTAIENNDLTVVSDILSRHFRNKDSVREVINSNVARFDPRYHDIPLLLASRLPDNSIVKYLITKHNVDINSIISTGFLRQRKTTTCLIEAVKRGHHESVEEIVGLNADVNLADHKLRTPLHHAINRADIRMASLLLGHGAQANSLNHLGNSPMHTAAYFGHKEMVRLLVSIGGADLYKPGNNGALAIHLASAEGHADLVRLMVGRFCVNPNIKGTYGSRNEVAPLHVACIRVQVPVISTLVDQCGADINSRDVEGETPLHSCLLKEFEGIYGKTKEDYFEAVQVLVSFGIDVNVRNLRGETALHLAARNEFQAIIELLLLSGADPSSRDNDGNLPQDLVLADDVVSKLLLKSAFEDRAAFVQQSIETRSRMSESFGGSNASKLNVSQPSFFRAVASRNNSSVADFSPLKFKANSSFINLNSTHNYRDAFSPVPPSSNGYLSVDKSKPPSLPNNEIDGESVVESSNINRFKSSKLDRYKRRENRASRVGSNRTESKLSASRASSIRSGGSGRSAVTSIWNVTPAPSVTDRMSISSSVVDKVDRNEFDKIIDNVSSDSADSYFDDDSFDSISEKVIYSKDDQIPKRKSKHLINGSSSNDNNNTDKSMVNGKARKSKKDPPLLPKRISSSSSGGTQRRVPELPISPETFDHNGYANMSNVDRVIEIEVDRNQTNVWDVIRLSLIFPLGHPATKVELLEKHVTDSFLNLLDDRKFIRCMLKNKFSLVDCLKKFSDYSPSHYVNESLVDLNAYVPNYNCEKYVLKRSSQNGPKGAWSIEAVRKNRRDEKKWNGAPSDPDSFDSSSSVSNEDVRRLSVSPKMRLVNGGGKMVLKKAADEESRREDSIMNEYLFNRRIGRLNSSNVDAIIDNYSVDSVTDGTRLSESSLVDDFSNNPSNGLIGRNHSVVANKINCSKSAEFYEELSQENSPQKFLNRSVGKPVENFVRKITFSADAKNLGFSFVGGNVSGIFIDSVDQGSSAEMSGLIRDHQIISVNGKNVEGRTGEEVLHFLMDNSDRLELLVQKGDSTVVDRLRGKNTPSDLFFVRAKFNRPAVSKEDVDVATDDIFCVSDSLPGQKAGSWRARRVYNKSDSSDKYPRKNPEGLIPNTMAGRRIIDRNNLENRSDSDVQKSSFMRSFRRSKSTDKLTNKFSFRSSSASPYERVLQIANTQPRPVALMGLFGDQIREKLVADSPGVFEIMPVRLDVATHGISESLPAIIKYVNMSANKNKHCLLRLAVEQVKHLKRTADERLRPLIVFLKPGSKHAVKDMASKVAPTFTSKFQFMFDEVQKFEKEESAIFDAVVPYSENNVWFNRLKETISFLQKQERWIGVDLIDEDDADDGEMEFGGEILSKTTDDLNRLQLQSDNAQTTKVKKNSKFLRFKKSI